MAESILKTALSNYLPTRLVKFLSRSIVLPDNLADHSHECLRQVCKALYEWSLIANGSEGYHTAEVILEGIDTAKISLKQ